MANRFFNQFSWTLEKTPVTLWASVGFGDTSTVTTVADISKSLAGTFFRIKGFVTGNQYYFWYSVSGTGSNPNNSGEVGINVGISQNVSATQVAVALKEACDGSTAFLSDFTVSRSGAALTFVSKAAGCANAHDGLSAYATGFAFTNTANLPFLDTAKSKGIRSFTRSSQGVYVATLGVGSPTSQTDLYPRFLYAKATFSTSVAPAAPNMFVSAQDVASAGTATLKFTAPNSTTLTDPGCNETLLLEFTLKNTTAQ